MAKKSKKKDKRTRPPRIRVPNNERALFTVDTNKFIGVVQRLSLTGGSAVLAKGPVPQGTLAKMDLVTVFGKVTAQIQFLHSGADGIPLAQAFRFTRIYPASAAVPRRRIECGSRSSARPLQCSPFSLRFASGGS